MIIKSFARRLEHKISIHMNLKSFGIVHFYDDKIISIAFNSIYTCIAIVIYDNLLLLVYVCTHIHALLVHCYLDSVTEQ